MDDRLPQMWRKACLVWKSSKNTKAIKETLLVTASLIVTICFFVLPLPVLVEMGGPRGLVSELGRILTGIAADTP